MRLAVILGGISGINILITFFYQLIVLTTIGPGIETDALFAAIVIPGLFLAVISGSLTHTLVPLFSVMEQGELAKEAWNYTQGITIVFTAFALILWLSAPVCVPLIVPGFTNEAHQLTIVLVRIQLIGMVFSAMNGVLWPVYHARQKFIWAEISPAVGALVGLLFLLLGIGRWGVIAAAWALVLRSVIQSILLLPVLGQYNTPAWRGKNLKAVWHRLYPLLLGSMYYRSDQIVDRFLSSMAPVGQLSLLHFAHQIYNAGNLIIGKAIIAPAVPLLSQKAIDKEWPSFNQIYKGRLLWMLLITTVIFLGIPLAGNQVLVFLFGHGRFEWSEIVYLKWLLILLGGVWVGGVLGQLLSTSFYAQGNTKTPTIIGSIGYTLGIGLKVMGFYCWGVFGLAIGTTFYYIFNTIWLKMALGRRIKLYIQTEG